MVLVLALLSRVRSVAVVVGTFMIDCPSKVGVAVTRDRLRTGVEANH